MGLGNRMYRHVQIAGKSTPDGTPLRPQGQRDSASPDPTRALRDTRFKTTARSLSRTIRSSLVHWRKAFAQIRLFAEMSPRAAPCKGDEENLNWQTTPQTASRAANAGFRPLGKSIPQRRATYAESPGKRRAGKNSSRPKSSAHSRRTIRGRAATKQKISPLNHRNAIPLPNPPDIKTEAG